MKKGQRTFHHSPLDRDKPVRMTVVRPLLPPLSALKSVVDIIMKTQSSRLNGKSIFLQKWSILKENEMRLEIIQECIACKKFSVLSWIIPSLVLQNIGMQTHNEYAKWTKKTCQQTKSFKTNDISHLL